MKSLHAAAYFVVIMVVSFAGAIPASERRVDAAARAQISVPLPMAASVSTGTAPAPAPAPPIRNLSAPCTCALAKDTNGWCDHHGFGFVAGVKVKSRLLYETMDAHGHLLDLTTFQCPLCQKAISSDGFCVEHRIGFVGKLTYFSRLTYEWARGEKTDPSKISCPVCRKNSRSQGWCETHQIGMVGKIAVKGRDSYQNISKAIDILRIANTAAERCEYCAVAIVTDSLCPFHRITYLDGHPVRSPGSSAPAQSGR